MDKRYSVLSPAEQVALRRDLMLRLEAAPAMPIPAVIREIRKTLRLTIPEYARLCQVSPRTLQDIERGVASPTLSTVDKLLQPMGLRAGAVAAASWP
ncbi:helix-turn-helix domain-containing protein [Pseudoduganella danionis]|uniref:Helix-turn-helix domain-containing protein n=2 Tax=Telluria group TaxID=2895353 RepID=A0A845I737_9BURK|nr:MULTISPECIES: helix-turn-helix transcriptional regulator [Telluria group]MTW35399.1 helix-turn-helix domain-containing protein [Pseudoduganella danionis]MYN47578.1 helix-turn-helix domain-containing protein [Duganella fentianensis]